MYDDATRGQETPDRQTANRLRTDGGDSEQLTNGRINELLDGLTGFGTFGLHTDHAHMDVDGFETDIEMDIAPGEVWLVSASDDPEGEYAVILDADDAAYLADVLARAAAAAEERDKR
ncbi:hypothetical protein [Haloplanus sp. C73]|uniref:hypothetical protein n=1 Tax=Haloplanus sp. C73 TaxID=3421641 RepID=UPI003EBD8AAA